MNIFVTGGTGFIGSHLVETLLRRGHHVTCLARTPAKADRVFAAGPKPRTIQGDLNDVDALAAGCTGADVVFHVAGLVAARSRAEFFAVNGNATRTLVSVASKTAPDLQRFVYVSSLAAAGPTTKGVALTEAASAQPVSDYGWSKLAGEEAVRAGGLPWTIIRPPIVYGPRDTEVFKLFKLAKRGLAVLFGDGSQELSFVYAPDLVEALIHGLDPAARDQVFFASHPEIRTSREFAREIHQAVKRPSGGRGPFVVAVPGPVARGVLWLTGTAASLARQATVLNADKANEFLAAAWTCSPESLASTTGWRAATDLATGLRQTTEWYAEAKWL